MAIHLGLDVGTQGVKAVLLDPERGIVGRAAAALATIPDLPHGHSEQHPEDWRRAIVRACHDLRERCAPHYARVASLGVSGQQHGLVLLDADHAVVRPAMLWNDVRCAAECAEIVAAVGGAERLFELTGLGGLPPGFTAGKLRWLLRHEPDLFGRVARVLLPHDWVNLWLTGRAATEAGDASGTGWLDVRGRRWSHELCDATAPGTRGLLPELLAPGAPVGDLRPAVALELGLPPGVLVAHGAGDNMAAAIGAGATGAGVAVASLGTSGTVFVRVDEPVCDRHGEIAPFCDSTGAWLPLGCTMNATVATEAMRECLGADLSRFEALVAEAPAGADGVLCLPFLTGERSPDLPAGTGALLGLTPRNLHPANLARAAMEGVTFGLCRLLDRLQALDVEVRELRLTGGGSNSRTWRAVMASASGVPVRTGIDADAAALGAAILGGWTHAREHGEPQLTIGAFRSRLGLGEELAEVAVDPAAAEVYARRRVAWRAAVEALATVFPRLQA